MTDAVPPAAEPLPGMVPTAQPVEWVRFNLSNGWHVVVCGRVVGR